MLQNLVLAAATFTADGTTYRLPHLTYKLLQGLCNMILDIAGPGLTRDVKKALLGGWNTTEAMNAEIYNFANYVFNVVKFVGCFLLLVHFLCDIMEKVTGEQFTLESFFKSLVKFFVGFAIIINCMTIFNLLTKFGNAFQEQIGNAMEGKYDKSQVIHVDGVSDDEIKQYLSGDTNISSDIGEKIDAAYQTDLSDRLFKKMLDEADGLVYLDDPQNIFKKIRIALVNIGVGFSSPFVVLASMAKILVPWIFAKITYFICLIIAYTRCVELLARSALAPMAITDIYSSGTHGNGFRYIKKYFSIALQGAIIIILVCAMGIASNIDFMTDKGLTELVGVLVGQTGMSATSALWRTVLFRLAGTGLVLKSQSLASEVVGA